MQKLLQKKPNSVGIPLYYQHQSMKLVDSNNTRYKTLQINSKNGSSSQRTEISLLVSDTDILDSWQFNSLNK